MTSVMVKVFGLKSEEISEMKMQDADESLPRGTGY